MHARMKRLVDDESCSVEIVDEDDRSRIQIEDQIVSKNETKRVTQLKLLVLVILVVSAITVGCGVFYYIRGSEMSKFHDNFTSDANKIFEAIGTGIEDIFAVLDLMSTTLVSHARAVNETWPFVTLPNFANRASKTLTICNGIALFLTVLVQPEQRLAWEEYAWENRGIVNESLHIMETDSNYRGPVYWGIPLGREIYDVDPIPYNVLREYSPSWHQYPIPSNNDSAINWDWYADAECQEYLKIQSNEKRRAVVSLPYILPDPNDPDDVAESEYWAQAYEGLIPPGDNPMEPASDILYPILNVIDSIKEIGFSANLNSSEPQVVGNIATTIYWRDLIRNVLPQERRGIVVVVDNPCKASFTYRVEGPRTVFLGRGDQHNPSFDSFRLHRDFTNLKLNSLINSKYTGVPMNTEYCPFTFNVYPSQEMKDIYVTSNATVFAIVAICIFMFTSIVFVIYDSQVERRQQIVMKSAVRSNAVVSSLFPSNVREVVLKNSSKIGSIEFDNRDARFSKSSFSPSRFFGVTISEPPIAELYPDTTVLFADIKGFTAWSSARDPHQVFTLLETLYGEFDKIARERKVFKVETIGDSYVAVTGLPEPMKNHAVTMSKFAESMLRKAQDLVRELATSLGPGTDDLTLRIGLNSGPTTAGVLRGEKSRFQLFGDTVNTASRMESTGLPTKIQCSQRTADLIIASGKKHWLTKREDVVQAKGKGKMQTYWVSPSGTRTTVASGKSNLFIEWNVNIFLELLKDLIQSREFFQQNPPTDSLIVDGNEDQIKEYKSSRSPATDIKLSDKKNCYISSVVYEQLISFISKVASMHGDNPYHNFEHTSHVVMGLKTLLDNVKGQSDVTIDALDRFSIVFAALIHDINYDNNDSIGPVKETSIDTVYTEWNVLDAILRLLKEPAYRDFRQIICSNETDYNRFFDMASNVVYTGQIPDEHVNIKSNFSLVRKKNDFIQILFQITKCIHTMQHWHVYQKWNRNLFWEAYKNYKSGNSLENPLKTWYSQEIHNFDYHVIPLIQTLRSFNLLCNDCETLLNFAHDNRQEWEVTGQDFINEWKEEFSAESISKSVSSDHLSI